MSLPRPILIRGMVVGMIAAFALLGLACEHQEASEERNPADTSQGPTPTHISWGAEFALDEGGQRRAVLEADRMERYSTEDSTYSVWRTMSDTGRVKAFLFDTNGDSSATVTADSILFLSQDGRFEAFGDVVVLTENNKRLESEHLTWDQADRTIRTRRFVHITTPTEVVQGNGLVADENLETYQIGRFTAEVEVDEGNEEPNNDGS